jgi:hypothetical protein
VLDADVRHFVAHGLTLGARQKIDEPRAQVGELALVGFGQPLELPLGELHDLAWVGPGAPEDVADAAVALD